MLDEDKWYKDVGILFEFKKNPNDNIIKNLFIINQSEKRYLLNYRFLAFDDSGSSNDNLKNKIEFHLAKDNEPKNKYLEAIYTTNGKDRKKMKIVFPYKDRLFGNIFGSDYLSKDEGEKLVQNFIKKSNSQIERVKMTKKKIISKIEEIQKIQNENNQDIEMLKKKISLYFQHLYFLAKEISEVINNAKIYWDIFNNRVEDERASWYEFDYNILNKYFNNVYPIYNK